MNGSSPVRAEFEPHPLAEVVPLMDEESPEFGALVEDIREHGMRDPIVLYEGRILDGRNRYLAWSRITNVAQPPTRDYDAEEDGVDPLAYVVSKNLHRRHLTAEQRGEVVRKLREESNWSVRRIAEMTGLPKSTVFDDLKRADPEEVEQELEEILEAGVRNRTPEQVIGRDGKSYPANRDKSYPANREETAERPVSDANHERLMDDTADRVLELLIELARIYRSTGRELAEHIAINPKRWPRRETRKTLKGGASAARLLFEHWEVAPTKPSKPEPATVSSEVEE